ncbi:DUF397 domain-containing protein [Thermocrispum municipale]|jgi:hypothetical protein|uniref:DUF397 domain-containing protein n=1 Tax=Thermocrispum municipale TaxID=37926 RepID=UPI0003FAC59C|nr:DUF397 domain-containing protein [Thermocrispum municipale]
MAEQLTWRKSSFSGTQGGNCVEVAYGSDRDTVFVRDSKNPDGGMLRFTKAEWDAFKQGVKNDEF